jgi:hypothetical protein
VSAAPQPRGHPRPPGTHRPPDPECDPRLRAGFSAPCPASHWGGGGWCGSCAGRARWRNGGLSGAVPRRSPRVAGAGGKGLPREPGDPGGGGPRPRAPGVLAEVVLSLQPLSPGSGGPPGWRPVTKRRRISRFSRASGQIVARAPRLGQERGCEVELTEVRTGGQHWWTLGFEATGPAHLLHSALEAPPRSCSPRPCSLWNPARINPGPTRNGWASGPPFCSPRRAGPTGNARGDATAADHIEAGWRCECMAEAKHGRSTSGAGTHRTGESGRLRHTNQPAAHPRRVGDLVSRCVRVQITHRY